MCPSFATRHIGPAPTPRRRVSFVIRICGPPRGEAGSSVSSEDRFLELLWRYGARRVKAVAFRPNRSTIWSLTRRGTVLNLHEGYRDAPARIVRAFAVIAKGTGRRSRAHREATREVREWPGIEVALRRVAARRASARSGPRRPPTAPCSGTSIEREALRRLYDRLNETRFDGLLPADLPLRLSARMRSRLGHMMPGREAGRRRVVEIALNRDLMIRENGGERVDTLLHEMAHAAAYLYDGDAGHGPAWRRWARQVGCDARARGDGTIQPRRRTRTRRPSPPAGSSVGPRGWPRSPTGDP